MNSAHLQLVDCEKVMRIFCKNHLEQVFQRIQDFVLHIKSSLLSRRHISFHVECCIDYMRG